MSVQRNPSACRHPRLWEITMCLTNESRGAIQKPSSHNSAARRAQGPIGAHELSGKRRTLTMACKFSHAICMLLHGPLKLVVPPWTSGPSFFSGLVATLSYLHGSPAGKGSICRGRGSGLVHSLGFAAEIKTPPMLAVTTNVIFQMFCHCKDVSQHLN